MLSYLIAADLNERRGVAMVWGPWHPAPGRRCKKLLQRNDQKPLCYAKKKKAGRHVKRNLSLRVKTNVENQPGLRRCLCSAYGIDDGDIWGGEVKVNPASPGHNGAILWEFNKYVINPVIKYARRLFTANQASLQSCSGSDSLKSSAFNGIFMFFWRAANNECTNCSHRLHIIPNFANWKEIVFFCFFWSNK